MIDRRLAEAGRALGHKMSMLQAPADFHSTPREPREKKYRQLMESAQDGCRDDGQSRAVRVEIELGKLIETLLRIAVEHAGAERGLLILFRSNKLWLEAEATTGSGGVEVTVRKAEVTPADLPESLLHHVIQTREA